MSSANQVVRLSAEEAKKLNCHLPPGYRVVLPEEFVKKPIARIRKKVIVAPLSTEEPLAPVEVVQREVAYKGVIEGGNSHSQVGKIFAKLKFNPALNLLAQIKMRENETTFKDIVNKIDVMGDSYKQAEFVSDIQRICQKIYETYSKNDYQYKDAANVEKYLNEIIKADREADQRKYQETPNLLARSSSTYSTLQRKKTQPKAEQYPSRVLNINEVPSVLEKKMLGINIKRLHSQHLQHICYMLFESSENKEYVFDTELLQVKKFRELQDYVNRCLQKTGELEQRNSDKSDEEFSTESIFVIQSDHD